jgi:hypothetical protein
MISGWRYRLASALGVGAATYAAVAIANHPIAQSLFGLLPVVGHLAGNTAMGTQFTFEAGVALIAVLAAFVPLYKPRPRRIVDTIGLVERRLFIAVLALATVGYFDFDYRLARATL